MSGGAVINEFVPQEILAECKSRGFPVSPHKKFPWSRILSMETQMRRLSGKIINMNGAILRLFAVLACALFTLSPILL
jgi:hypothetical protein